MAVLKNSTVLNEHIYVHIYVFGRRRWVKPDRKWRTPTLRSNSREEHTKPDTTGEAQSKKINCVLMFGCAAREIIKNKSSLPALQELPSPQDFTKNQTKPGRRPMPWSKFGKFKVGTEKTARYSYVFGTTTKRQGQTYQWVKEDDPI